METLQVAVNNIKNKFTDLIQEIYVTRNYGLKSCNDNIIKSYNSTKLELIFLSNIGYVCLTQKQLLKIKAGSFKNLFVKTNFPELKGTI